MSELNVNTIISILGILSTVIIVLVKIKPGLDDYFRKGTPILAEIDDIIDAILFQFPKNDNLNTINDILDKILSELKQAGYEIDDKSKKKIENRLKAQLKREGFKLDLDPKSGEYMIRYDKNF
ncbi:MULTISPECIES: hypothetical protein [unclassified Candidatus Frackibacter]|uniref:hypothetical protein n=1 Tax=unclassified Candidatus Frackibacter TaxID=2648818 RepID=UPI000883069D|nr:MULTISPECIES: hypothetical protein [unclassified Candidatus Frackibacter]SDC16087.1 hypothetical protein SAMN04515661_10341 [Candidatus Frackibacter sp. WG11]SEM45563.1 hypothetical protein SAMN04488698_104101 [Candidatus Frackibacter sp. WG12]SFL47867.1 hypothetical protein SAMN04488699_10399 [Candidatus Frackibacter sp. WG13]